MPKGLTGLQPTLQKLGIQLSKHKVAALTREEKDVSVQLLYRIKSALATMNASIAHAQGMNTSKLAATFGMKTELSKGLVEAQQFRYDTLMEFGFGATHMTCEFDLDLHAGLSGRQLT